LYNNKAVIYLEDIMSEILNIIKEELIIMGVAAVPVLELRGSIPMGLAMDIDWRIVYILSVIGNLIPVPFIIFFMRPIFSFLREKTIFNKLIHYLETRTQKKTETVMKYSAVGLFLLVFIPLPGTGAWTGSMVAAILDMRFKYAFPAIFCGVICAGIVVMLISKQII
jgi:uncharacterized membrane protein